MRKNNPEPSECPVNKDLPCLNKKKNRRSHCINVAMWFFLNYKEIISSESCTLVASIIQETVEETDNEFKYIVYDNACKLNAHVKKHPEKYPKILNAKYLIDRFHIRNHKNQCFKNYNSDDVEAMKNKNTSICEKTNFMLNRFRFMTKHMTLEHYDYFFLNYMDFENKHKN